MDIGVQTVIAYMLSSRPPYLAFWATADKTLRPPIYPIPFLFNDSSIRSTLKTTSKLDNYLISAPPAWLVPAFVASCIDNDVLAKEIYAMRDEVGFIDPEYLAACIPRSPFASPEDVIKKALPESSPKRIHPDEYRDALEEIVNAKARILDSDATRHAVQKTLFEIWDERFAHILKWVEAAPSMQMLIGRVLRVAHAVAYGFTSFWREQAAYYDKASRARYLQAITHARIESALWIADALIKGKNIPYQSLISTKQRYTANIGNGGADATLKHVLELLRGDARKNAMLRQDLERLIAEHGDEESRAIYAALYFADRQSPSLTPFSELAGLKARAARMTQGQAHPQDILALLKDGVRLIEKGLFSPEEAAIETAFLIAVATAKGARRSEIGRSLLDKDGFLPSVRALLHWLETERRTSAPSKNHIVIDSALQYLLLALPPFEALEIAERLPLSELIVPWLQAHFIDTVHARRRTASDEEALRALAALSAVQISEGWGYAGKRWDDKDARDHADYLAPYIEKLPGAYALLGMRRHVTGTIRSNGSAYASDTEIGYCLDMPAWAWAYLLLAQPFLHSGWVFSGHVYAGSFVPEDHPFVKKILQAGKMNEGKEKIAYLNIAVGGEKNRLSDLLSGVLSKQALNDIQDLWLAATIREHEDDKVSKAIALGL